jgi:hypothetical protein
MAATDHGSAGKLSFEAGTFWEEQICCHKYPFFAGRHILAQQNTIPSGGL